MAKVCQAASGNSRTHGEYRADDHNHASEDRPQAHAAPEVIEKLHAAAESPSQQEQRIHRQFEQAEARAGHGIVGGFLMGIERDLVTERRGYRAAMCQHMRNVPAGQPDLEEGGDGKRGQEQLGERVHECELTLSIRCVQVNVC